MCNKDQQEEQRERLLDGEETRGTDTEKKIVKKEESHLRSLLKGISYRVIETFVTIGISYFVLGDVKSALQIGVVEFFVQIVVYYIHERFCTCVPVH